MNRWEKLGQFCLRIVQELRIQRGTLEHVGTELRSVQLFSGTTHDTMARIEAKLDETLASHAQANRQVTALSGEVARLARRQDAAEGTNGQ